VEHDVVLPGEQRRPQYGLRDNSAAAPDKLPGNSSPGDSNQFVLVYVFRHEGDDRRPVAVSWVSTGENHIQLYFNKEAVVGTKYTVVVCKLA